MHPLCKLLLKSFVKSSACCLANSHNRRRCILPVPYDFPTGPYYFPTECFWVTFIIICYLYIMLSLQGTGCLPHLVSPRLYKTRNSGPLDVNWHASHSQCLFVFTLINGNSPMSDGYSDFHFLTPILMSVIWRSRTSMAYFLKLSYILYTSPSTLMLCSSKYNRAPTKSHLP